MKKILAFVLGLMLFANFAWGASQTFQGTLSEAPAIKAVTANAGSGIVTGNDSTFAGAGNWTAGTNDELTIGGGVATLKRTTSASNGSMSLSIAALKVGSKYKVSADFVQGAGYTGLLLFKFDGGASAEYPQAFQPTGVSTTYSFIYTPAYAQTQLIIVSNSAMQIDETFIVDNVTISEIPLSVSGDAHLTGNVRIVIPTYPNNAAALAGGLVAGQFYRVNAATDPEPIYIVH